MAKAAISSGGGGSFGKGVSILDALAAEASALQPPPDAFTVSYFMSRPGINLTRVMAVNFLERKVRSGILCVGRFASVTGGRPRYYWPAGSR